MKQEKNKTALDCYYGAITKEEIDVLSSYAPDVPIDEFVRLQIAVLALTETERTYESIGGSTFRMIRHANGILKDGRLLIRRRLVARCVARHLHCQRSGRFESHKQLGQGYATYLRPLLAEAEARLAGPTLLLT